MKLVYLDESGVSAHEPVLVVAGVVVDADTQLSAVEDYLDALVSAHIEPEHRDDFCFHATELWSGTRYFSDRKKWPLEKRLEILSDVVGVIEKFDLPIAMGWIEKAKFPATFPLEEIPAGQHLIAAYTVTMCSAAMVVEKYMREISPDEVAILIAEDKDDVREHVKVAIKEFRKPDILSDGIGEDPIGAKIFPFTKIRDTVHFAKKKESRHLQLADVCAFFIRGHLMRSRTLSPFINASVRQFWRCQRLSQKTYAASSASASPRDMALSRA